MSGCAAPSPVGDEELGEGQGLQGPQVLQPVSYTHLTLPTSDLV